MNSARSFALIGAAVLVVLSQLVSEGGAAVAAGPALVAPVGTVSVIAPAPGHSTSWNIPIKNQSDQAIEVTALLKQASGPAFEGAHPMTVRMTNARGVVLMDGTPSVGQEGKWPLGRIEPGASYELRAEAALARGAGDEYRNAVGIVDVEFSAMRQAPLVPPELAFTGFALRGAAIVALVLAVSGGVILARLRRRARDAHSS